MEKVPQPPWQYNDESQPTIGIQQFDIMHLAPILSPVNNPVQHPERTVVSIQALGSFLLEVGVALLRAGAATKRIRINLRRLADAYGYSLDDHIEPRALSLSLRSRDQEEVFNGTRVIHGQVVNFKMISGISRMSWSVVEKPWTEDQLWAELDRLKSLPDYPRVIILLVVALAGAAFCFVYGGGLIEMAITFGATFCGLWAKQELVKRSFNPYLITYLSAVTAGMVTVLFSLANQNLVLEHALTTSFLFLIPGVQLINSISDLMDGEVLNGIDRGVNALMHALGIALGLSTLIFLFSLHT
jgi:uncharacterized membrane protein YjjP (DUF1212 family)